jgi:hypothetical protein
MSEKKKSSEEITEAKETGETKGFVWTPETMRDVLEFVKSLADKYLTYKKNEAEARQKFFESKARHNKGVIIVLIIFLSIIVLGMSYLTLNEYVSGDALLFLIGTITGYVLLFIQRLVFPSAEEESELPSPE